MRKVDNLVIGSTYSSCKFALEHGYSFLNVSNQDYKFFDSYYEEAIRLKYDLYMNGLMLNHNPCDKVRIEGKEVAYFNGYFEKSVCFDKLFLFDYIDIVCDSCEIVREKSFFRVMHWMSFRSGGSHQRDDITIGDKDFFLIHFYRSRRTTDKRIKDAIVFGYGTEKDLQSELYDGSMARLKLLNILEEQGFRGAYNVTVKGKRYYLKPVVEVAHSEVQELGVYSLEGEYGEDVRHYNTKIFELVRDEAKTLFKHKFLSFGRDCSDFEVTI